MIDPASLAAFALTALLVELTPGPNMGYLALLSAGQGRRAGFAAVLGVAAGLAVVGAAAALGLAALVERSPGLYQAIRWGGVLWLVWLAWEAWRDAGRGTDPEDLPPRRALARHFLRGFVTNVLNPKAAMFYLAVQPAFLPSAPGLSQVLELSAVYVGVATAVHAAIVALAGGLRNLLGGPARQRSLGRAMAAGLVGVALWMLWKT